MKEIPDRSVDFILTDPPYGTTACKWDIVIPFDPMWEQIRRVLKLDSACALFCDEPFASFLRQSNIRGYKYDWIWEKDRPANINCAKLRPMKYHEMISIFEVHHKKYYPQKILRPDSGRNRTAQAHKTGKQGHICLGDINSKSKGNIGRVNPLKYEINLKNPSSILKYPKQQHGVHPTQKPVPLLEYLIKTYTLEGETVLDFTMGSGSTGVACQNLRRKFIGIEKEREYFKIAKKRLRGKPCQGKTGKEIF